MFKKIIISALIFCAAVPVAAQHLKPGIKGEFGYSSLELDQKPPYFLRGEVINKTDRNWKTATFQISLYDKHGQPLRESVTLDNVFTINDLKRGEKKPIGVSYIGQKLLMYKRARPARMEINFIEGTFNTDYEVSLVGPKESKNLTFENDSIWIRWSFNKSSLALSLRNLSTTPIKIDWNQARYIDVTGTVREVGRQGIASISGNNSPLPTVVPPYANIQERLLPVDRVGGGSRPVAKPMFPDGEAALSYQGKSFQLYLPIEINGKKQNHLFVFKVTNVKF